MQNRLRLYYPVKPFIVTQTFGANIPCVRNFGLPTQVIKDGASALACPFGYDKLYQKFGMSGHNGVDISTGVQKCYAACDGIVIEKQTAPARGLGLGILTNDLVYIDKYGEGFAKIRYWHLKEMYVEAGQKVNAGQLIGMTDNTGYSSGNHLHIEVQPMGNDAGGHPYLLRPEGSIAGAIDPLPFFTGTYAEDLERYFSLTNSLIVVLEKLLVKLRRSGEEIIR